jgi:hypothetical protein
MNQFPKSIILAAGFLILIFHLPGLAQDKVKQLFAEVRGAKSGRQNA